MASGSLLLSLFVNAFLAATLLPFQSEALLSGLLLKSDILPAALILTASVGNTLGSCVNWWLGTKFETYKDRKWFPASAEALRKANQFYNRYGCWSLLLAWVPLLGDPLTVIAGFMKLRLRIFLLLVAISKTSRYLAVYFIVTKIWN